MTDRISYESERSDVSAILAIVQGKLPGSIETFPTPDFGKQVLTKCWSLEAVSRPTMTWCSEVLAHRTTALFTAYRRGEFAAIPSGFKSEGDGWRAIRNPDSVQTYDLELKSTLRLTGILCVVRPTSVRSLQFTYTRSICVLGSRALLADSQSHQTIGCCPSSVKKHGKCPSTTLNRVRGGGT